MLIGDRYDWTTGAPHDGNEWKEARDLIFKIRSCTVRSDLKIKVFSAVFCLF